MADTLADTPGRGRAFVAQVLALAIYAAWVIGVGLHHEAWFDEMQAWLLARDNSFATLIGTYARYEGTPGLWHAILWVAARAGLPFGAIWVLSVSCAIVAAAVVLWRAPFPLPLRIGLLCTWYFGYQYSVVARGYCLDLMLLPVAASLFATRVQRPLGYGVVIGLLANINAFSFLAAGLLGLELLVRLAQARRLMLSGTIFLISPAWGRMLPMPLLGGERGIWAILTMQLLLYFGVAAGYDLATRRRVHPAYFWGIGGSIIATALMKPVSMIPAVAALAHTLTGA